MQDQVHTEILRMLAVPCLAFEHEHPKESQLSAAGKHHEPGARIPDTKLANRGLFCQCALITGSHRRHVTAPCVQLDTKWLPAGSDGGNFDSAGSQCISAARSTQRCHLPSSRQC